MVDSPDRIMAWLLNNLEFERMCENIQTEMITNIRKQLVTDNINFTFKLSDKIEKRKSGDFYTVELDTPYARFVEFGLPPGNRPNFDALRYWVEHKLGVTDENALNSITMKISNKITNDGIEPRFFLKKAIKMLIGRRGNSKRRGKGGK